MSEATTPSAPPPSTGTSEPKSAETSSDSRKATARLLHDIALTVKAIDSRLSQSDKAADSAWEVPRVPSNSNDAVVRLSFAIADSSGVLDKALIDIPIIGVRTPVGCRRAASQLEESVTALFVRPLMDTLAHAVIGWATQTSGEKPAVQFLPAGATQSSAVDGATEQIPSIVNDL